MTTPRRPSYAQLQQQVAGFQAVVERLEEDIARLKSDDDRPTRADLERAQARIDDLTRQVQDQQQRPPAAPPVDLTPLEQRVQSAEDEVARLKAQPPADPRVDTLAERVSAVERRADTPPPPPEPSAPPVNLAPLEQRLQGAEDDLARLKAQPTTDPRVDSLAQRVSAMERQEQTPPPPPEPPPPPVDLGPLEQRVQAVEDRAARMEAVPPPDTRVDGLTERMTAVERRLTEQAESPDTDFRQTVLAALAAAQQVAADAKQEAAAAGREAGLMAEAFAREIAALREQVAVPAGGVPADVLKHLHERIEQVDNIFNTDAVLFTAKTRKGLQVPNAAIGSDLDAAKIASGDIATARMQTNVPAAINASAGGVSAAKISTGDLPQAQMQTNVGAAVNAGATAINGSKVTGALDSSVTIGGNKITGNLTLSGGQSVGLFGAAAVGQQTRGATLTNSVTSGGSNDVIADIGLVDYATDGATIRNNIYQLARAVRMHDVALRAIGIET